MGIIGTILVGLVIGALARFVMPGEQKMGWILTILLGIGGSMLAGFVFLSHQVGSFLGVWLGGKLYDATGSYNIVWWISVALGVFAAVINLPVRESAIVRPAGAAA